MRLPIALNPVTEGMSLGVVATANATNVGVGIMSAKVYSDRIDLSGDIQGASSGQVMVVFLPFSIDID